MESDFGIVEVDSQVTLEKTNMVVDISYEDCLKYHKVLGEKMIDRENDVYKKMADALDKKLNIAISKNDPASRRIVYVNEPHDFASIACTTSIQLLQDRERNKLTVYQRSMSSDFFISDVAFFMNLCVKYKTDLTILIGSFHFII